MSILQPVIALAIWTMVMLVWLYAVRIPAILSARINPDALSHDPEMTLDKVLPPRVQWKAHNFTHLHESPTVFYAVAISLAVLEADGSLATGLAWIYVALRIVHSLVQATVNKVQVRFAVFILSSLVLAALIILSALAVF